MANADDSIRQANIDEALRQAHEAAGTDDPITAAEHCRHVVGIDPENAEAWLLLARVGGWHSGLCRLDIDFAIEAARKALELVPEGRRYDEASGIYDARKHQIGAILESQMTMPSHSSAKQLQETMMRWERLLAEIPYLTAELIENEITLVGNLCTRSKAGIMPGDRIVYTAYATFNGKEPYGETFRKALESRLEAERRREGRALERARQVAAELAEAHNRRGLGEGLSPEEERAAVEADLAAVEAQLAGIAGLSNRMQYAQQVGELERQMAEVGRFQLFKRREIQQRLDALQEKLAEADAAHARTAGPLEEIAVLLRARLDALSG